MHGDDKIAVKERWITGDLGFAGTPPLTPHSRTAPIYLPADFPDQVLFIERRSFTKRNIIVFFLPFSNVIFKKTFTRFPILVLLPIKK